MNTRPHEEDIDFEPDDELGTTGALKTKLQKLKEELEEVKKERQEYLDGWQRCKADAVNARKEDTLRMERIAALSTESFVEDLLPTLDAFDMAMQGSAWQSVDKNWRAGVEHIHTNLLKTLGERGVAVFGAEGEPFDHALHEAVQEEKGAPGVIVRVLRRGYKAGERIIRPAQVVIGAEE